MRDPLESMIETTEAFLRSLKSANSISVEDRRRSRSDEAMVGRALQAYLGNIVIDFERYAREAK